MFYARVFRTNLAPKTTMPNITVRREKLPKRLSYKKALVDVDDIDTRGNILDICSL